jgi:fructose-specific phosphotransferase system IIC component
LASQNFGTAILGKKPNTPYTSSQTLVSQINITLTLDTVQRKRKRKPSNQKKNPSHTCMPLYCIDNGTSPFKINFMHPESHGRLTSYLGETSIFHM